MNAGNSFVSAAPWSLDADNDVIDAVGDVVACVWGTTADSHLIYAAPELLDSVKELIAPLLSAATKLQADGKALDEHAQGAFDRARAAIAKAEGRA